ncbi:FAD-dependent oxidoreductase [Achromobacter pestifer]|uniref:FAD-dependent urate hydroxylase n=1 Tax=Achromobacter pestifer TaxID=1353889 RepID=A0A6S6YUG7_9BURK|nr:NAD(P)/FAD-dependent oxidoreductase [Achromobacter pestifer]CAB3638275.1 FAD-dependent urate hydroxylase [Achromobacter pestifer]
MTNLHLPLSIGIAGAGSAGLATALALAQAGHQVHVFEKHQGFTTMGAGLLLQPPGVRALRTLGVDVAALNVGAPIDRLLGLSHRGWRIVDIDYVGDGARAVTRAALGGVLFDACQRAGVTFSFGCPVQALDRQDGKARVVHGEGSVQAESTFDVFVVADGAASLLREQVGLAAKSRVYQWGALWGQFWVQDWAGATQLLQRFRGTRQMMGLLPTEIGPQGVRLSLFWSIRHDALPAWRAAPIGQWKDQLLALWPDAAPVLDQVSRHDDLAVATYRHTWPRGLATGPYCAVGDAGHAMSPQLGLGTTLAVLDALALAAALRRHGAVEGPARYARSRLLPSRMYQTLSRALTPCFQASGPGLWRDLLFGGSLLVPGVRSLMKRGLLAMPEAEAARRP